MTRPMVRIHNVDSNEIIDREMNDEEYAQWELDVAADKSRIAAAEQAVLDKTALLAKLGITQEEANLLLG
jgi:hypothetical protein